MKIKKTSFGLLIAGMFFTGNLQAQQSLNQEQKMEWFQDAKLGIFIHWGIYAVDGVAESWSFFNNYISHSNYMKQLGGFTASKYNPEEWARLISGSGAKYSVITTRHHDGISLWDSQAAQAITTAKDAVAQRDVLTPFVSALQKAGLKTGLYYSLPDWSHPFYNVETGTKRRYEIKEDPTRWGNFIQYYQTQLRELSERYHPDLLWFDGDWEHTPAEWHTTETLSLLRGFNPNIIINSRLDGKGDYDTPEQGIPVVTPNSTYWELCYTMNDSWGYQPYDLKYKSPNEIVRTLADVISMGGNLLLDIGPKAEGTIPEPQVEILKELGRWTSKHAPAVYGTRKGLDFKYYPGKSALSKDQKTLFLYLEEAKDFSRIYGLKSKIESAEIVGDSSGKVSWTSDANGNTTLNFSQVKFDPAVTVVRINFKKPVELNEQVVLPKHTLAEVESNPDTAAAVFEIAERLHAGENILKGSDLTVDGEDMPSPEKANPAVHRWITKHAEALYETGAGLPNGHYSGMSALSKDRQTLYLFVEGKPTGPVALKGLKNKINRTRITGEGTIISSEIFNKLYWSAVPGIVYLNVPQERLDENLTVLSILLDGPIELYREKVGAVESNF